jgi:hypothetical protein
MADGWKIGVVTVFAVCSDRRFPHVLKVCSFSAMRIGGL